MLVKSLILVVALLIPNSRGLEGNGVPFGCEIAFALAGTRLKASGLDPALRSYYVTAHNFASKYGDEYCRYILDGLPKQGETTLLISMGGAEHLGTLLETYLAKHKIKNVKVRYAYLTTKIVGPWEKADWVPDGPHGRKMARSVGYGNPPPGAVVAEKAGNTPEELVSYLRQVGAFESSRLIVVDTGRMGSIPEAVASLARMAGYASPVEGRLLDYAGDQVMVGHTIAIKGFTPSMEPARISKWAQLIEEGVVDYEAYKYAFQRSAPSASKLVRDADGLWKPNSSPYQDKESLDRIQATRSGISDAMQGM